MPPPVRVDLQVAGYFDDGSDGGRLPDKAQIRQWTAAAIAVAGIDRAARYDLSVRLVDEEESRALNHRYRNRDKPTNVLSFPFERMPGLPGDALQPLGDLVICGPVVRREAQEQGKEPLCHLAHMVVHGTLHLLGYDHQTDEDAATMEALERRALQRFGIDNPYY